MECRVGCAACCIAITISSPIPGMPSGKPAGVPCVQLTEDYKCKLFGKPERPAVCGGFAAAEYTCGETNEDAFRILRMIEEWTKPTAGSEQ